METPEKRADALAVNVPNREEIAVAAQGEE